MKPNNKGPQVVLFWVAFILVLVLMRLPAQAIELRGTVIAVQGAHVTIKVELVEPFSPRVGNKVDLIEYVDGGNVAFVFTDWQITEVNGAIVKAEAANFIPDSGPKVNMTAVIHIPPGPVHAGAAPPADVEKKPSAAAKGKIVMLKGKDVTIQLNEGAPEAAAGDRVEISFTSDGVVIPVGTWRVTRINANGTVEAELLDAAGEPNIDMDAVLLPGRRTPKAKKKPDAAEKGADKPVDKTKATDFEKKAPVEKESAPKTIEAQLALFSKTDVTKDFIALGKSLKCYSGKVRIYSEKIEMTAKGGPKSDYCTLKMSDETLGNFYATLKISVDTTRHNDFRVGIIFGSKTNRERKSDSIYTILSLMGSKVSTGFLKSKTNYISWMDAIHSYKDGRKSQKMFDEYLPDTQSNPTPGTLEFLKINKKCMVFWNGKKMGSWDEEFIPEGQLWLAFSPVTKGKATAVFKDVQVYRLDRK